MNRDEPPYDPDEYSNWKANMEVANSIDAFGKLIADNTTSLADLASHYKFSPQRSRVFVNGNRAFVQYNSISQFDDTGDDYVLIPGAGDTVVYKTAERFRYAVGYMIELSQAFDTNQELQTGDKVVIGYGDADLNNDMAGADGWFLEFTSDLEPTEAYATTYRDGTELDRKKISFQKSITDWRRIEQELGWYNVANRKVTETFTDNGEQKNYVQGKTSIDDDRGPVSGNQRLTFGVTAGTNTTNLKLLTGSKTAIMQGDVDPIVRLKTSTVTASHSGAAGYEPIAAIRVDPDNSNVFCSILAMQIMELSSNEDVKISALSVDPGKTDATGFVTNDATSDTSSAIEQTTSISTFPDSNGNIVTSAVSPGGYQVGHTSLYTSGQGSTLAQKTSDRPKKNGIFDGDIIVFAADTGGVALDITFEYTTEQEW